MDSLPKLINQYPELLEITRPQLKNVIFTQKEYCPHFIDSLIQIYKFYFEIEPVLFVPRNYDTLHEIAVIADLENLENIKNEQIVIFAYSDILFNELLKINKRRISTILKNLKCKVIILSITDLKVLQIGSLEKFNLICTRATEKFNLNLNLFDYSQESFVEMVESFKDKRVYISLCLNLNEIKVIESLLKQNNKVFRKEPENGEFSGDFESGIVINSSKTTQKCLLKFKYDIYIYYLPQDLEDLDLISFVKNCNGSHVYIESSSNEYIEKVLSQQYFNKIVAKDSKSTFETVQSIKIENLIVASEEYYCFTSPESIQKMDLRNLTKKDYDTIRNFIKLKLINKFDLDIKTCQLSTPCSPKDRSRKLNSLSNKISSVDYRCDVTCEIFKDYSIGVVVWNETFTSKEPIVCLKNETYVYQKTQGKWKYTQIF